MSTTSEFRKFGKADMSFLTEVGKNVDLAGDRLIALLEERFPRLTMTPQPIPVHVERDNNRHLRR